MGADEAWEMDGAAGWVYFFWALENKSTVWGTGLRRVGDGYAAQEANKMRERKQIAG